MPHLMIIGQKFIPLTLYLNVKGYTYTVLQDISKTKFPEKKLKNRIVTDFSSNETLFSAIDSITTSIDGVITVYENYIIPTSAIAQHLGLPGLTPSAAEACNDKSIMRSLFNTAPEKISPDFSVISNEKALVSFAQAHSFPLILKPANLSKSLLVTKSDSFDQLIKNYRKSVGLLATTYKKYAPNHTPKLIVEEFLEGSIHSVDAFVDSKGIVQVLDNIVDYKTGYDIGYDDNFHYSRTLPSKLPLADQQNLRRIASIGVVSLGMKSSAAHIEIIMTKSGPYIVEIGARNGGYRERMHRLANGIDINGAMISTALDQPIDITTLRNEPCVVLELFPKTVGIFQEISQEKELRNLSSLAYFSIKVQVGSFVGKAADGHKMCAVIILHNKDTVQFKQDLEYISQYCQVITQ